MTAGFICRLERCKISFSVAAMATRSCAFQSRKTTLVFEMEDFPRTCLIAAREYCTPSRVEARTKGGRGWLYVESFVMTLQHAQINFARVE